MHNTKGLQKGALRYGDLVQNKDMEQLLREQVLESLIVQELLYARAKTWLSLPATRRL